MRFESQTDISVVGFDPAIARAASRTLHDAAQPLTVVQGLLELTLLQARSVEEYRESVEAALVEMARVGDCFNKVRQIVRLQQPANDVVVFRMYHAVALALQELKVASPDVELLVAPRVDQDFVAASQSRTHHALSLLLSAATLALNGDRTLHLSFESLNETCVAHVRTTATSKKLHESIASAVEMAQVVGASAGGRIEISEVPFAVSLVLPKAVRDQSANQKGTPDHV
jgi:signal transduction histidine kinase